MQNPSLEKWFIDQETPNKAINQEMEDNAMEVIEKDGHRRDIEPFDEHKVRKLPYTIKINVIPRFFMSSRYLHKSEIVILGVSD
ncbi:unnamed protein product [marine sediment metagenome]|uniref:Uncharacterized protein n=1 Tax=marine sediment metagenome TaxID=412755 RepID=X1E627_9ZZZZ